MRYDLSIRQQNIQPHLDIEREVQAKKNGLLTFILRVNAGNIADFAVIENVDTRIYRQTITIQKFTFASGHRDGGQPDAVRPDNLQRNNQGRSRPDELSQYRQEQADQI